MNVSSDRPEIQRPDAHACDPSGIPDDLRTLDRWLMWARRPDGKGGVRKVPLQPDGRPASSTDPATWSGFDACRDALERRPGCFAGLGIALGPLGDGTSLCGVDLDACRDPASGELAPWAARIVAGLRAYAEVSPSGTGIKLLFLCEPAPVLARCKRVLQATGAAHPPAVEFYVTGRFFCATGWHLDGTPDELVDATPEAERLATWTAKGKRGAERAGIGDAAAVPLPEGAEPPQALLEALDADDDLAALWRGEKEGGDTSRSGLDASLAVRLAARLGDDDLAAALSLYPHGQLQALDVRTAWRRLGRLLAMARAERRRLREAAGITGAEPTAEALGALKRAFGRAKAARAIWRGERDYPDPRKRLFAFCASLARAGLRDPDALHRAALDLEAEHGRPCPDALAARAVMGALQAEGGR